MRVDIRNFHSIELYVKYTTKKIPTDSTLTNNTSTKEKLPKEHTTQNCIQILLTKIKPLQWANSKFGTPSVSY
jgi:hypothetical protein